MCLVPIRKGKAMIKITEEKHQNGKVLLKLEYDKSKIEDETIINSIRELLKLQPNCKKCINYTKEGGFSGYMSSTCKIYGNLEFVGNPFHDMDASRCESYVEISQQEREK